MVRRLSLALIVGSACALAGAAVVAPLPADLSSEALTGWWDANHVDLPAPPLVSHATVEAKLADVQRSAPELFSLERIGTSVEGRGIHHLAFGRGPLRVLLWSQMHGDEPTATVALFDVFEYVRSRRGQPEVERLLDALTVHAVPMLNPDGAERFQRRNAQGIDINRDALLLQTPEGRALKALRDRLEPQVGFNLHNQNWRTSTGRPPRPASMSLLSVAYDDARSENEGRRLTKRLCAVIRDAVEPLAPGQMGRYDDEFEVRAFGDNVTSWGTSVVLIETGAWPGLKPDPPLVRLNFVALMAALDALASGRVHQADPSRYETLPENDDRLFHTLIRNATIVTGTGVAPFSGDVGIVAQRVVRREGGARNLDLAARIEDVGDLRVHGALETIDATGLVVTPAFAEGVDAGDVVRLPNWSSQPATATVATGQPAHLFLLEPGAPDGGHRVARVLRLGRAGDASGTARAFVGARLFTGTGIPPIDRATILVRNGRVEAIGPGDAVTVPANAVRVDLSGRMVVPGLVNAHGHVGATKGLASRPEFYTRENLLAQLRLYARYGVTTVLSLGDDGEAGVALRDEQDQVTLDRARLFVAGPVVAAASASQASARVDEAVALRPDWIKVRVDDNLGTGAKMADAAWRAAVDRAHQRGLPVAAHVFYLDDARALAGAGVELIAHSVRDRDVDADFAASMARQGACYSPTLTRELSTFVYERRPAFFDDPFFLREADQVVVTALLDRERQDAVASSGAARAYKRALPVARRNLKALADAGVRIAMGTDSGPPARFQGYFEHLELEMMVEAGLSPLQALVAATGDAARCMGKAGEIGTLTPGAWADLVVLTADPLTDIRNTRAVESVWIAGNRIDR